MCPEVLAERLAATIRGVVAPPLAKQIAGFKGMVAALETRDARQTAATSDLQKSYSTPAKPCGCSRVGLPRRRSSTCTRRSAPTEARVAT
jgi:hypothetical protein